MANDPQNIVKTVSSLMAGLSPRNKDIISRRFGLKNGRKETLESIGKIYGITRERVRQIEESTLAQLVKSVNSSEISGEVNKYISLVKNTLSSKVGIMKEDELLKAFSGDAKESIVNASLSFILVLDKDLKKFHENNDFHSFWTLSDGHLDSFKKTTASLIGILEKHGRTVPVEELYPLVQKNNMPGIGNSGLTEKHLEISLAVSKNLDKNIFDEVGLTSWSEIHPKGVRDKAYLVLKKSAAPKHFTEIAKLINSSSFSGRKANVQTVHNELIKDQRFVLVGRGTYALSEWGYKSGTVKDVLMDILKDALKPMPKSTLIAKVKDARMVKENTVLLNLQDSKTFVKNKDGNYMLRSDK